MKNIKLMGRAVLVAGLILIGFFSGRAQSPSARFSISGVVGDQAGATIAGASVVLGPANTPGTQFTTTDQAGRFEFKRIAAGQYQLHVSYQGFEATTLEVNVGPQSPAPLQVV